MYMFRATQMYTLVAGEVKPKINDLSKQSFVGQIQFQMFPAQKYFYINIFNCF